jgi:integrase
MTPPKLDHVKYVRSKGHTYAYFNTGRKVDGKAVYVPLPKPGSAGFFDSYAACLAGRNRKPKVLYTAAKLFDEYQDSREFAALAEGTRQAYGIYLRLASELLGKAFVDDVTRADIQYILDEENWGAGKQNLFVAVIGSAYRWGRARDKASGWPTREIRQLDTGEHKTWPDDVLDAALAAGDDTVRLAAHLLFYTGQRIGDVCMLRWSNVRGGAIRLTQQKTAKALTIPMHGDLKAELDRNGKRGLTLLTNVNGGPMTTSHLRAMLKRFCAGQGHPDLKPHGLRKNAVIALLTAGCSVAETAAITGQTYKLVEYYARQIDQESMAGAAIFKLEQNAKRKTGGKPALDAAGIRDRNLRGD